MQLFPSMQRKIGDLTFHRLLKRWLKTRLNTVENSLKIEIGFGMLKGKFPFSEAYTAIIN